MKSRSTKMMAVLMVSLMAVVALAPLAGEETDAAVGDGGAYSYTLTYHSDQISNTAAQETQLTVDGMTPISHESGTTTLSAVANEGSWSFNTTTGIGPFNSFYGAFDMTDGNKFVSILNPYDLTKKIDGTALDDMTKYNIMWVLPTVYWSVDNSGNLTLTNDPSAGTAYAHTINGHTYKYLAIGVYEASASNLSGYSGNVLKSQSSVAPTVNQSPANYLAFGSKYNMDSSLSDGNTSAYSMVWNFYQWELYKYCAYTVMEGFDDSIVGNGNVYNSAFTASTTGSMNGLGPYVGNPGTLSYNSTTQNAGDPVKLFIENAWGSAGDYVSGIVFDGKVGMYVNTANSVTADGTTGDYVEYITQTIPDSGWITDIVTSEKTWGYASATQSDASYRSIGLTDKIYSNSTILAVGGYCSTGGYDASAFGLNFTNMTYNMAENYMGTRLAFVMDNVLPLNITITSNNSDYGTVSSGSVSVPAGTTITASTNTISLGTSPDATVITATPTAADAQYTYAFDSWTGVPAGGTVTEDLTITANFTRTINEYTITWVIGESSETTSVAYGSTPTHADPTPPEGYYFVGWDPEIVPVTAAATYTAVFSNLTVTFDPGNGTLSGPTTKNVTLGQPIGELPTATPNKATYNFIGWFDSEGNEVTSETIVTETESFTLYAQYELDDSLKPVKAMTDLLPLIFVVGIIILMIGTAFYYYRP